jgi:hypothetical protein
MKALFLTYPLRIVVIVCVITMGAAWGIHSPGKNQSIIEQDGFLCIECDFRDFWVPLVWKMEEYRWECFKNCNVEGFNQYCNEDYSVVAETHDSPVVRAWKYGIMPHPRIAFYVITPLRVQIKGNVILIDYDYKCGIIPDNPISSILSVDPDSVPPVSSPYIEFSGRITSTWINKDNAWELTSCIVR